MTNCSPRMFCQNVFFAIPVTHLVDAAGREGREGVCRFGRLTILDVCLTTLDVAISQTLSSVYAFGYELII